MERNYCRRCGNPMYGGITQSWFIPNENICSSCAGDEAVLVTALRRSGKGDMHGCGYIPKIKQAEPLKIKSGSITMEELIEKAYWFMDTLRTNGTPNGTKLSERDAYKWSVRQVVDEILTSQGA